MRNFLFKRTSAFTGTWTPSELFASGEQGFWHEPNPTNCNCSVNTDVAELADLSGTSPDNTAQPISGIAEPILRQDGGSRYYIEFDGTTKKMMEIPNTYADSTNGLWVVVGYVPQGLSGIDQIINCDQNASRQFQLRTNGTALNMIETRTTIETASGGTLSTGTSYVVEGVITTSDVECYIDGSQADTQTNADGTVAEETGNVTYVGNGRRTTDTDYLDGDVYFILMRNQSPSAQERSDLVSYVQGLMP